MRLVELLAIVPVISEEGGRTFSFTFSLVLTFVFFLLFPANFFRVEWPLGMAGVVFFGAVSAPHRRTDGPPSCQQRRTTSLGATVAIRLASDRGVQVSNSELICRVMRERRETRDRSDRVEKQNFR